MRSSLRFAFPALMVLLVLAAGSTEALPRYAARYGQKCLLCHSNPTGGGMRSAYASQYLVPAELSLKKFRDEQLESIDPFLNDRISMGADLRTLYVYNDQEALKAGNNFFQMQGDVYLQFQADERLSLYLDQGIKETGELYGMAFVLPANGYVKIGRFVPSYGWRFADHQLFVRDLLGFGPPGNADVGLEAGIFPGNGSFSVGLLNGSGGQLLDTDNRPAMALRGEWRQRAGPLNLVLGGSLYRDEEAGPDQERLRGGPFFSLAWGPLSWVGEWDWQRTKLDAEVTALFTSHELAWQLRQGLFLRGTYSFHDPDLDLSTGAQERVGLGLDLLATPFFGVLVMVDRYRFEEGEAFGQEDYGQIEIVTHFLY